MDRAGQWFRIGSVQFSISEQLLRRIVKQSRGGLVFKAHRLLYHSTLGSRAIKKKKVGGTWPVIKASMGAWLWHARENPASVPCPLVFCAWWVCFVLGTWYCCVWYLA